MYYVMPDRFYPGDGYVRVKLTTFEAHGWDASWHLTSSTTFSEWASLPMAHAVTGPTYHKYGATDFYAVDPDLGTEQTSAFDQQRTPTRNARTVVFWQPLF